MLNLKARVVAKTAIPANRVLVLGRRQKTPTFNSPSDILLRSTPPVPLPEWQSGSGRIASVIRRVLTATLRVRSTLDRSDRDELWLTGASGMYALEDSLMNALEMYIPADASGNFLVYEPLRLVPTNEEENRSETDPAWGQSVLSFSVFYASDLDQSEQ